MNQEDFIAQMKKLAACALTPEDWLAWWDKHEAEVWPFLNINQGEYGRLKPVAHEFRWVPVLGSQKGALRYLEDRQIAHAPSGAYQTNYEKELDDYCKAQRAAEKQKLLELKAEHPLLFERYPKFAASLKSNYSLGDTLAAGATAAQIQKCEQQIGFILPAEIASFFQTIAALRLDGLTLALDDLRPEEIRGKTYCVLGELWKEADGDLLLFDPRDQSLPVKIYYYAHELDEVRLLKTGMPDLLEKTLTQYNRSKG